MERGSTLILRRNFVTRLRGSSLAAAVVACSVGIVAVASYAGSPAGSEMDSRVIVRPARALPAPGRNPRPALERGTIELAPVTIAPEPHPLDGVPATELKRWIIQEPDRLGPVIVGRPNRGALLNAIAMEDGANLEVMHPERSFGTAVTVRSIEAAAERVRREFSNCTPLRVGDISRKRGGYLRPHRSHQSGIDADLGYYYMRSEKWYTVADADTLDRACTWALVKALIAGGNVEYIFMDRSVQVLLELHALRSGEDPGWLDELFEASRKRANRRALVRHTWGHRTHLHVRFHDHVAEETGARAGKLLKRAGKL